MVKERVLTELAAWRGECSIGLYLHVLPEKYRGRSDRCRFWSVKEMFDSLRFGFSSHCHAALQRMFSRDAASRYCSLLLHELLIKVFTRKTLYEKKTMELLFSDQSKTYIKT